MATVTRTLRFRLLGPLEVTADEQPVQLGGAKQRLVLAHLLLRSNQVVGAERLIADLWGDEPPASARGTLQSYVSHLRRALDDPSRIEARPPGYRMRTEPGEVDAVRFEELVREARRQQADPQPALDLLDEALALWRGSPFADLSDERSLQGEIARLEELRLSATEDRVATALAIGRHRELIPELEALCALHPLRERMWSNLMLALYRSGRQAEALAAFARARQVLTDELGIDPSPELQALHERILRQEPALEQTEGTPLRGYRLLERVGQGAFGVVFRAEQPQASRTVAVKVLHPRLANSAAFIRRFEPGAEALAQLQHPNIVPLYDYWRAPDQACLVTRFLPGGSLRELLSHGPMSNDDAVRVIEQVALGLAAAHRAGIVHRDLKPANVLLDDEGNAGVADFAIAKDVVLAEGDGLASAAFAPYASPEEIRGGPVGPASDIYSLGIVLFETLTGHHPFAGSAPADMLDRHLHEAMPSLTADRDDLGPAIRAVIERATAKDPADRYQDATAFASHLRAALVASGTAAPPQLEVRNPFKGLRPFAEADAGDFFGRDRLIAQLIARFSEREEGSRFLAVVGPSGSGKSSVVRAGVLPELRAGGAPGSTSWFVADMVPGSRPLEELEAALLRIAVNPPPSLIEQLERDEFGLARASKRALPPDGSELLLFIDQFEELFTLVEDEARRAHFLESLTAAIEDPASRVRLLITLRADFFDRPLAYRGFGELVAKRTEAVTPLADEELELAITGPLERMGVRLEPRLLSQIVSDVTDQPGALPLLQYALTELFDRRRGTVLTLEAYREIGGVSGALARRAEEVFAARETRHREAVRQLFLRLVTLGEEGAEDTRRRVLRSELASMEGDPAAVEWAIDAYGRARLLSFDRDPVTRGPTVELAHEALLKAWDRLRDWIDLARDDLRTHRKLVSAATEWAAAGEDPSFLVRGARLDQLAAWSTATRVALTASERRFLAASLDLREVERSQEEERRERERRLERRALRRLRALVAVLTTLALVAGGLTAFSFSQQAKARHERTIAFARELAAASASKLTDDPELAILLAIQAVRATRSVDGTVLPEASEALHQAVQADRVLVTRTREEDLVGRPELGGVAFSPDGTRFATTGDQDTAVVWDARTGDRLLTLTGHQGDVTDVTFSPDGGRIATASADRTARIWDAKTGAQLLVLSGHTGLIERVAFSPDGGSVATASWDGTARIWDAATGNALEVIRGSGPVSVVAFSPDGKRLAVGERERGIVSIWDIASRTVVVQLRAHVTPGCAGGYFGGNCPRPTSGTGVASVTDIAFDRAGDRVATTGADGTTHIWNARTGASESVPISTCFQGDCGQTVSSMLAAAFSPTDSVLATGGFDGILDIIALEPLSAFGKNFQAGDDVLTLDLRSVVTDLAYSADGSLLAVNTQDGTTRILDVHLGLAREHQLLAPLGGEFDFSADGSRFATLNENGITMYDTAGPHRLRSIPLGDTVGYRLALSPDGTRVAVATANATATIWDARTGGQLFVMPGRTAADIVFSADGSRLATTGADGIEVWSVATGKRLASAKDSAFPQAIAFSPDGTLLATGADSGEIALWNASTGALAGRLSAAPQLGVVSGIWYVVFSSDGSRLATSSANDPNGLTFLWNLRTRAAIAAVPGHGAAFSPDAKELATAGADGRIVLWDAESGAELQTVTTYPTETADFYVAFAAGGRLLVTESMAGEFGQDRSVRFDDLGIDDLIATARARLTRSLTGLECRQYLHLTSCP